MRTIGEKLGVTYLLEGSVRKSENQLRITAQLIKAEDGYHLFSKTYERELKDIFAVQDEIAKEVTTALSITLGAGEFNRPGMTRNIEAYDMFLRAVSNFIKYTPDSMLIGIDQIKKALDMDPEFGNGWVALYESYLSAPWILPPEQAAEFVGKTTEALERLRAISPDLPDLAAIMAIEKARNGEWLEAEGFWRKTIEKTGHASSDANANYGKMLLGFGRINDALPYFQRAKRLDPMDSTISIFLSMNLSLLKRRDEAIAEARRGQTLEGPNWLFIGTEDGDMIRSIAKSIANSPTYIPNKKQFVELLLKGDREAALTELKKILMDTNISPMVRLLMANLASAFGEPELAFQNISSLDIYLSLMSIWDPIQKESRKLPAFKTWIRDIGIYDYWRESGEWGDFCHPVGDDDFECE